MKKWVCPVCGYVHEGDVPPAECPVCHVAGEKFTLQAEEKTWAAEHVVGVGKVFGDNVPEEVRQQIIDGLRANFEGECTEVGMYLAMARVAHREDILVGEALDRSSLWDKGPEKAIVSLVLRTLPGGVRMGEENLAAPVLHLGEVSELAAVVNSSFYIFFNSCTSMFITTFC